MPALTAVVNDIHNNREKPMENALKSDPLVYQFIIVIIIDFEYCQVYHVTIRQHILGLARGPVMMN